jgi:23S rRNA G2069 N7-methylase RlmK/C1962 C5-methylase RlmI
MPDGVTIAGAGVVSFVVAVAPKGIELVRTWLAKRAEVAIEHRKAGAREETARHRLHAEELGVAERMILDRAEDHRACREEVAELRDEVGHLRVSVASCEAKHDAAQSMIDWLKAQVERLDRKSAPPTQEPAE